MSGSAGTCRPSSWLDHSAIQGLAADLKAELRELLSSHGITSFVVKPVKRSYAFEDSHIPHGLQWVLKVRCPGSAPTLPLGISGKLPTHQQPAVLGGEASPCGIAAWKHTQPTQSVTLPKDLRNLVVHELACPASAARASSPVAVPLCARCTGRQEPPEKSNAVLRNPCGRHPWHQPEPAGGGAAEAQGHRACLAGAQQACAYRCRAAGDACQRCLIAKFGASSNLV